jgi:hypothetical protein
LIVWLHGCGEERGWDNRSQLQYLDETLFATVPGVPSSQFYVLAPQAPLIPDAPGVWHYRMAGPETRSVEGQEDEMLIVVMKILDKTLEEEAVDSDRVTLVGLSCASGACLELGIRYPKRWAALREERFGIEPEVTAKIERGGWRVAEVQIRYQPRNRSAGKKVGFRDGLRALWCILRYSRWN